MGRNLIIVVLFFVQMLFVLVENHELITGASKKAYTLVMGKSNPAKLANFPECDAFIYVSCAQTALLDSKEYLAPVITPFEVMIAFNSQWTGAYVMEFRDLINLPQMEVGEHEEEEARFSFLKGGYVEDFENQECLKKRLFSTNKTNSAHEFEFEFNNQLRNEFVHDSTFESTPRLKSDSEGEKMWILRCKVINQSMYHVKGRGLLMSLVSDQGSVPTNTSSGHEENHM